MRVNSGKYHVSPSAVKEMLSRLDMWFELNTKLLCGVAKSHGRKTVMEDDVTEFFSVSRNGFKEE